MEDALPYSIGNSERFYFSWDYYFREDTFNVRLSKPRGFKYGHHNRVRIASFRHFIDDEDIGSGRDVCNC